MDLATLIGIIGSFAFILMAMITSGGIGMYADMPSVYIVFGGSIFIVLAKFSIAQYLGAFKIASKAFIFKTDNPEDLIAKIVEMADAARKGGFLALEEIEVGNTFLRKGIDMLVDGHDAEVVRNTLQKDTILTNERHEKGIKIFESFGDVGPAMGMIGTLIGLVAMLSNMSDPKSIGPAMAVALLTTLYGSILANMVAIPIANKLELRKDEERLNRRLIVDGVLAIQDGQNPRVIDSFLKNYLNEKKRDTEINE